jgi:hypothetical protein
MPVLMVFETIIGLLWTILEIASSIYVCFVLWHVNIYNDVMIVMFYVICLSAVCGTNFDAPSVTTKKRAFMDGFFLDGF